MIGEVDIALVTGASRGIGRAVACEIGRRGATVVGTATSEAGAEAISAYLDEQGISGRGMRLDVTELSSVDAVVAGVNEAYGTPTVLINNAGITRDNLLIRMKEDEWDVILNTNLSSVYRVSRAVLRGMMKARYGRIISITSVVGSMGNAGQTNYAASKAGILGFTKSLAREVGSRGITVNAVAPGYIDTDMTRSMTEEQRDALIQGIPASRLGHVDDVSQAVAFLASRAAGYITGETLNVNGGMYMS